MFKQLLVPAIMACVALTASPEARCHDAAELRASGGSASAPPHSHAAQAAETLLDEILAWLPLHFDLPAINERPAVGLASRSKLARLRASDRHSSQGFVKDKERVGQREVVALYDDATRTILLADDWVGTSPADRSVLVHELVHHVQNVGKLKFDCPQAREKLAYLAQDKWLQQFGTSLEDEFDVDMFTVLISSTCLH